jgi:TRAP-type C4-dicarboxylate transport system permease small subunit
VAAPAQTGSLRVAVSVADLGEESMKRKKIAGAGRWLRRRADDIAVALMGIMFLSFLLQIAFRYLLNQPLGWTEEVTVLCWVWVVLWCAAFVVSDQEEIRFDIVYTMVPPRVRRLFTAVSSIGLVILLILSLPASWSYVTFMKREHTAYLHMRLDLMYSVYVIFVLACVVKHVHLAWRAVVGAPRAEADETEITTL